MDADNPELIDTNHPPVYYEGGNINNEEKAVEILDRARDKGKLAKLIQEY